MEKWPNRAMLCLPLRFSSPQELSAHSRSTRVARALTTRCSSLLPYSRHCYNDDILVPGFWRRRNELSSRLRHPLETENISKFKLLPDPPLLYFTYAGFLRLPPPSCCNPWLTKEVLWCTSRYNIWELINCLPQSHLPYPRNSIKPAWNFISLLYLLKVFSFMPRRENFCTSEHAPCRHTVARQSQNVYSSSHGQRCLKWRLCGWEATEYESAGMVVTSARNGIRWWLLCITLHFL